MYKIVFSDLDETLLYEGKISDKNIESIHSLIKHNIKFVVATGRPFNLVTDLLNQLDLKDKEGQYSVCLNGACIVENKTGNKLYYKGLDLDIVRILFKELRKANGCIHIVINGTYYMFFNSEEYIDYGMMSYAPYKWCNYDEFEDIIKNQVVEKVMLCNKDYDYILNIGNHLNDLLKDKVSIAYSSNQYIEINTIGVDKGKALHYLCEYLQIKKEESIAIGDNLNDLSMIIEAGKGCSVLNAVEEVKDASDYISDKSCKDDGFSEIIKSVIFDK